MKSSMYAVSKSGVQAVLMLGLFWYSAAVAQETRVSTYELNKKAVVSITNNYGPITIEPSRSRQVVVRSIAHSDTVRFESEQHGKRVAVRSLSSQPGVSIAEYAVLVPGDSFVIAIGGGTVHAKGLSGDLVLESGTAPIEVSDIENAHIHVRTIDGPIALSGIRNSHLDIHSVNGNVRIVNVTRSWLNASSATGRIEYDGDPGTEGEYLLSSRSGDLELSIPASALVEIKSHSIKDQLDQGTKQGNSTRGMLQENLFFNPRTVKASRFVVRSFSGTIRLKRP